jgi:hypothetical protein
MIIQSDEEIMILLDNVFTNRYSRIRKSSIKRIRKKMHFKHGYFSYEIITKKMTRFTAITKV